MNHRKEILVVGCLALLCALASSGCDDIRDAQTTSTGDSDQRRAVLCVVQKMRQDNARLHYKCQTDARESGEIDKENLYLSPEKMRKLKARKVTVDLLGRVRRARD